VANTPLKLCLTRWRYSLRQPSARYRTSPAAGALHRATCTPICASGYRHAAANILLGATLRGIARRTPRRGAGSSWTNALQRYSQLTSPQLNFASWVPSAYCCDARTFRLHACQRKVVCITFWRTAGKDVEEDGRNCPHLHCTALRVCTTPPRLHCRSSGMHTRTKHASPLSHVVSRGRGRQMFS